MTTSEVLRATLISPNESDRNMEEANVVDGLFAIARGLQAIAKAVDTLSEGVTLELNNISGAVSCSLTRELRDGCEKLAVVFEEHVPKLANAIRDALSDEEEDAPSIYGPLIKAKSKADA